MAIDELTGQAVVGDRRTVRAMRPGDGSANLLALIAVLLTVLAMLVGAVLWAAKIDDRSSQTADTVKEYRAMMDSVNMRTIRTEEDVKLIAERLGINDRPR